MINEKICKKCNTLKTLDLFSKDKSKRLGVCSNCKDCSSKNRKKWYDANKTHVKEYQSKYEKENRELINNRSKKWRSKNRDHLLSKRRLRHKERYLNDKNYVFNHRIRSMLNRVLSATGKNKDFITFKKIGYTADQLISRIECQFKKGMDWDNMDRWEIDHKIPISIFVNRGETRPEIVNALSNLQPLWIEDNRSKGARFVG